MATLYKLLGSYVEPYYWHGYYPESDEEITEEIYYRQHPSVEKVLGLYLTEDEAKAAKQRFEKYSVITNRSSSYTEREHPYKDVRYVKVGLGDQIMLPPTEPESEPDEPHEHEYEVLSEED